MSKPIAQATKGTQAPAPDSQAGRQGTVAGPDAESQLEEILFGASPDQDEAPTGPAGQGQAADDQEEETAATDDEADYVNPLGDEDPAETDEPDDGEDEAGEKAKLESAPKWAQKRIDKLTAQKHEFKREAEAAKAEAAALKAEADSLRAGRVSLAPTPADPLADVTTQQALDERISQARLVRDWCLRHPEGGTLAGANGQEVEFDAEEVAARRAAADDVIAFHAPQRRQWLAEHEAAAAEAKRRYPALFKPGHGAEAYASVVKRNPAILADPQHPLRIGRELIGYLVESGEYRLVAKAKAPATEKTDPPARTAAKPPPSAPVPAHAPRRPESQRYEEAKARAMRTGDAEDVLAALEAVL